MACARVMRAHAVMSETKTPPTNGDFAAGLRKRTEMNTTQIAENATIGNPVNAGAALFPRAAERRSEKEARDAAEKQDKEAKKKPPPTPLNRLYLAFVKAGLVDEKDEQVKCLLSIPPGTKLPRIYQANGSHEPHFKWTTSHLTLTQLKNANRCGAGGGVRGKDIGGLDFDGESPELAALADRLLDMCLGLSPKRGRGNSRRFFRPYRYRPGTQPIKKWSVHLRKDGADCKVEWNGDGNFWVATGKHTSGVEYEWEGGVDLYAYGIENLSEVDEGDCNTFKCKFIEEARALGFEVVSNKITGAGGARKKKIGDASLVAPSPALVLEILKACPNNIESYDDFITHFAAVKASFGDDAEDFYPQAEDRALTFEQNTPEWVRDKWLSIKDAAVGWDYLAARARSCGFNTAQWDFDDTPAADGQSADPSAGIPENAIDRMLKRNVYVKKQDKYFDHEEGTWLTSKGFNAANTRVARYGRSGIQSAEAEFQNNPDARKVVTTTYRPGEPVITKEKNEQGLPVSAVNQWRPSSVVPAKNVTDADVKPWLALIDPFFGNPTPEREHFLNYIAHLLQKPGKKIGHAIVLLSNQGFGKDSLLRAIFETVGIHNLAAIDTGALSNQFNPYLRYELVYLQEAKMDGHRHRDLYNFLKPFISAQVTRLLVNEKNMQQYYIPNNQNWIITSNHDTALTLEDDDRRFWVHGAAMDEAPSDEFFTNLHGWYEAGGIEKVAGWLLQRDLSGFNPMARPPLTAAKKAMLELSQPAPVRWLCEQLAGSLAHRQVVTVRELKPLPRQDWTAPSQGPLTDKQVMAALKAAGFKAAHRVRLGNDIDRLWARGLPGSMAADAMREQYEAETDGGTQCKTA
jgi:hypothetical protein